jgi:hypothetical protein
MNDTGMSPSSASGQPNPRDRQRIVPSGRLGPAQPSAGEPTWRPHVPAPPGVEPEDAVRAFCEVLDHGDLDIQRYSVRFKAEAIELTLGLALVRTGPGSSLRWRACVDEHESQNVGATHTVTIRLVPQSGEARSALGNTDPR